MQNYLYLLLRKVKSTIYFLNSTLSTIATYAAAFGNPVITIKKGCRFGKSVKLMATDGGAIFIGNRTCLGDSVQIVAQRGRVTIEDEVFIGAGSIIVCKDDIFIGKDTLIAEYVVIRDQDHRTDSRPLRLSGFHSTPIRIGHDVWIGCKATVLRGSSIGDRCVIGAHALVKSHIADDMLAVGTPARAVRRVKNF